MALKIVGKKRGSTQQVDRPCKHKHKLFLNKDRNNKCSCRLLSAMKNKNFNLCQVLGTKIVKKHGVVAYELPNPFSPLIKDALAIKKNLEMHINHHTNASKLLLTYVDNIIYMVSRYSEMTQDIPFDWESKKFLLPDKQKRLYSPDIEKNIFSFANDGVILPACYVNSITKKVGMVRPINDPNSLTVGGLKQLVARALVDLTLGKEHEWKLPEINDFPLNEKEKKIWLEFDNGTPEVEVINLEFLVEEIRSIEVDHPIVSVIGEFAIAAFNKACEMYVKKGEHNNLHEFEVMECKYLKLTEACYFYMTIEAIEEGNIGVYKTEVVCKREDGTRSLNKFVKTDRKPVGTRAMALSQLSCLESICEAVEVWTKKRRTKLDAIRRFTKVGKDKSIAFHECGQIRTLRDKVIGGLNSVLGFSTWKLIPLLFPPDWSRVTNPDDWSLPDDYCNSGMVRRSKSTIRRGYDYLQPTWH